MGILSNQHASDPRNGKKLVGEKWRIYGKMKKLSVQGKKWNKRILEMKESNEFLFWEKKIRD